MDNFFILNEWTLNYNNISYRTSMTCLSKNIQFSFKNQKAVFETNVNKYKNIINNPIIYIPSMGYKFNIYADNKLIYTYAPENFDGFPSHLISIPESSDILKIETYITNYSKGICENITLSNTNYIYKEIIKNDFNSIIVISLGVSVSLISLLFFILYPKFKQLFFLSLMSLIISIWSFSNKTNQLKQFIYENSRFWGYLDLISLFLIPTSIFLFFKSLIGHKLKYAYLVSSIFLIFTLFSLFYSFFSNQKLSIFLDYFNYLLAASGAYLIYTLYVSIITRKITIILSVAIALIFGVKDWLIGMGILPWERHTTRYAFLLFIFIVSIDIFSIIKNFVKNALTSQLKINAIQEAMSAIAHEIRRPFSIIDGFFPILKKLILSKNNDSPLDIIIHPLQNSLKVVDNIIYDIIDIGSNVIINKEFCDLKEILQDAILELYNNYYNSGAIFKWNINVESKIYIDKFKIRRVIINLLSNAIEAMKPDGIITITSYFKENFLILIIHNTNSTIPENLYQRIFEPYYTFNKTNGTGIGLALCKKFIEAHNGKIIVKSDQNWCQFEINIKLECSPSEHKSDINLLSINSFKSISDYKSSTYNVKKDRDFIYYYYLSILRKKITIALIDDEYIYHQCLCETLASNNLDSTIEIKYYDDINKFLLTDVNFNKHDAYIFDLDFGHKKISGIDFLYKVNINELSNKIAVSSNRITKDMDNKLIKIGIKNIFKKPFNINNLSKFIFNCIENNSNFKPTIVLIDDENYIHKMWEDKLLDANFLSFSHPEYFIEECIDRNNIIKNISIIIIDYYFDNFGYNIKSDFVRLLKNEGYDGLIILSSNSIIQDKETLQIFDFVIKKKPYSFKELINLFYFEDN